MPDLRTLARQARLLVARFRRSLSAVLAGLAVLAVIEAVAPPSAETRPVVVASRDVSAGAVLSSGDVRVAMMPPSIVPAGSVGSAAAMVGHVVAGPLRAGEVLTDRRVLGADLLAGYPHGLVAAPLRIADAGVVGLVEVGDRVDVYAARHDSAAAEQVVGAAPVVALPRPASESEAGALVVLAVTSVQAAVLAQASATSPMSLTLLR